MKKIIIDTNFLMIPYKFKVDIFSEFNRISDFNYELFIFEQSIKELNDIAYKQSGRDRRAAQFALKLIKLKNINVIKSKGEDVDSLILNSVNENTVVATQDMRLKKELLKKCASVMILRQKKFLCLLEGKLYK